MRGRNKCKILKEIRQKIADENDILYVTGECKYQGECSGTCPKCESELRYLERELEKRRSLGKAVTFAGVAVTMALSLSSCEEIFTELGGKPLSGEPLPPVTESADIEFDGAMPESIETFYIRKYAEIEGEIYIPEPNVFFAEGMYDRLGMFFLPGVPGGMDEWKACISYDSEDVTVYGYEGYSLEVYKNSDGSTKEIVINHPDGIREKAVLTPESESNGN